MNERELEQLMKHDIEIIFTNLLKEHNYLFPISTKTRGGAEISDYLEDGFVAYLARHSHQRIYNPQSSPKGATKNPYDFCFNYKCEAYGFDDLIWGDIKATKFSYTDSNPDLGTPEKIIKFIMDGHFYLLFVFLNYESTEDNQTKFLPFEDGRYVHCQFLKDVNHSVRINPKPQFQVNIHKPEEYRTHDEFLELFYTKYKESIERNIEKQRKKKSELDNRFASMRKRLKNYNDKFNTFNP
ncbi:MAG: hypothetical protein MR922_09195 [Lachnospiraceae bacterium]|nr:hypothetical protein [Lachnospiraceae bacterium]